MTRSATHAILPAADGQSEILTAHSAAFQEALSGAARIIERWLEEPGQQSLLALQEEWLQRTPASAQPAFRDGLLLRLEQRVRACRAAAFEAQDTFAHALSEEVAQLEEDDGHLTQSASCTSDNSQLNRPARQRRNALQLAGLALRLMLFTGTSAAPWFRAHWTEFDLEAQVWRKPAEPSPHCTPLPDQAVGLLLELQAFTRRQDGPLFDGANLAPEQLQAFLEQLGYSGLLGRAPSQIVRAELGASGRFGPALIAQHFDGAHDQVRFELSEQAAMLQAWANHLSAACAVAVPSYRQLSAALQQTEGWRYE
ncbi:hypothetical protein ACFW0H_06100 [Pseudomonas sp. CR3202]|uniref:hypothetical protein n=1 Tax=Pseudomonas sp. CR3202 TaxID=3351532 RepID=UPI003BF25777